MGGYGRGSLYRPARCVVTVSYQLTSAARSAKDAIMVPFCLIHCAPKSKLTPATGFFFNKSMPNPPPPPKAKTMALAALGNTYFDRPSTRPLVPSAAFGPVALNGWLYHQFKRRTRLLRACRPGFGDEVRNGVGHSLSIRRTQPLWVNRSKCAWDPCHSNGVYSVEGVWL
jgi:hypothetical protein